MSDQVQDMNALSSTIPCLIPENTSDCMIVKLSEIQKLEQLKAFFNQIWPSIGLALQKDFVQFVLDQQPPDIQEREDQISQNLTANVDNYELPVGNMEADYAMQVDSYPSSVYSIWLEDREDGQRFGSDSDTLVESYTSTPELSEFENNDSTAVYTTEEDQWEEKLFR